jgi:hypothetical protein
VKARTWLFAACLLLGACAQLCKTAWIRDTLYFGFSKPGGAVSAQEWQAFVDAEVTPRFPDGLTQWPAQGQWREKEKDVLKEESRVLEIVHLPGNDADEKIQAIRNAYKKQFSQSSVLRVSERVKADF